MVIQLASGDTGEFADVITDGINVILLHYINA